MLEARPPNYTSRLLFNEIIQVDFLFNESIRWKKTLQIRPLVLVPDSLFAITDVLFFAPTPMKNTVIQIYCNFVIAVGENLRKRSQVPARSNPIWRAQVHFRYIPLLSYKFTCFSQSISRIKQDIKRLYEKFDK